MKRPVLLLEVFVIKAIIFDFDGVLAESVDIKTKAFTRLFEHEGERVVKEIVEYHIKNAGVSRFEKFGYIYKEILKKPLTDVDFQDLCNRFSQLVVDEVVNAPFVKGAKEFLENYSSIYDCYVASATPQEEMEKIVKRRQMSRYFKGIYGSPKKKGDIVREILATYTLRHAATSFHSVLSPPSSVLLTQPSVLSPQSFVYVGDALSDYEAAKENNVAFIARITHNNGLLFKTVICTKIQDLQNLRITIDSKT